MIIMNIHEMFSKTRSPFKIVDYLAATQKTRERIQATMDPSTDR
jgi:hypothetical protein